ncbi:dihydrouridine synthase-like protein [Elsinoe australis]|uniref:tRNA-dihydrouridine(16/17) synthase [NAD(P)(+)] n=1 Tax=Elsinoe australis TaxID=40998 RepID=A0A4U7AWA7_9PEZI|nr:dihydrouridine synthase-like protein [Elsinoe australis]
MEAESRGVKRKLHGRAFYESIGSPKYVLAPMVDQSEFAWRLLSRSFMTPEENPSLLCYTPMLHARLFSETPKYRDAHFQPMRASIPFPYDPSTPAPTPSPSEHHLDGHPTHDRPLFVQFCANEPASFLSAALAVSPYCDAVDLNLGCPQGIAKRGGYGAFLQEDWGLISSLIRTLHEQLPIPVTAKMRILETKEKTLDYAKMILDSGASVITVHGRRREQKGHNTGLADWSVIRYLRESLPKETVIFANGNVLQHGDIAECLEATGADAVMSAEGNLYDPTIFAKAPEVGNEGREYWRGRDGKGGYRMDAVLRRYMDIIWRFVLGKEPPERKPLFMLGDPVEEKTTAAGNAAPATEDGRGDGPPAKKKQKREKFKEEAQKGGSQKPEKESSPNLVAMQAHLFHLLRPLVARHTAVRNKLARTRTGDIEGYEALLTMVEDAVKQGLIEYAEMEKNEEHTNGDAKPETTKDPEAEGKLTSTAAVERCKRPWFIVQPYVRPLPEEAIEKGALQLSKKEKRRREIEKEEAKKARVAPEGKVEAVQVNGQEEPDKPTVPDQKASVEGAE